MRVSRSVLLITSFAALLVVVGGAALAVWRSARNTQRKVAALHNAHFESGAALSAIRASVYLTAILTRDYLLDSDPTDYDPYVDQFNTIRSETEHSFEVLTNSRHGNDQRSALEQLRKELNAYWDTTAIVLAWTPEQKRAQRLNVLAQRVHRRQEIFALVAQIEQLLSENFTRERQRITTADEDFRSSFAGTAGFALLLGLAIVGLTLARVTALERQSQRAESELRLLSGQIRTTQEQERKYLSRELHDQVGQLLTGLRMELAGMKRLNGDSHGELDSKIIRAKAIVEQTLRVVRNIAMLLRPSMLDNLGLTPALAWLIKEVSRSSGIEIKSDIDPALDSLPDAYRTCLYRVVQEALTNASRHSTAQRVELVLKTDGDSVQGAISDNGLGFDPSAMRVRGSRVVGHGRASPRIGRLAPHQLDSRQRNAPRNSLAVPGISGG